MKNKPANPVLRRLRLGAGFDRVADAAKQLGVHPNTLYNWENGRYRLSAKDARAMAELYAPALRRSVHSVLAEIVGLEEAPTP